MYLETTPPGYWCEHILFNKETFEGHFVGASPNSWYFREGKKHFPYLVYSSWQACPVCLAPRPELVEDLPADVPLD